jgi:hypothetical protein
MPRQQLLPYSYEQPMILSDFNGRNEQDIASGKAGHLVTSRQPVAQIRPELQDLDARQSHRGFGSKLNKSSS